MECVKRKYEEQNGNENSKWDTLKEALVTSANDVILKETGSRDSRHDAKETENDTKT